MDLEDPMSARYEAETSRDLIASSFCLALTTQQYALDRLSIFADVM
jgi:hypothetical protein